MKSSSSPLIDTLEQASAGHIIEVYDPLECRQLCSCCKGRLVAAQARLQTSRELHSDPRLLHHKAAGSSECKHSEHKQGSLRNGDTARSLSNCHRMHTRTSSPAHRHKQLTVPYLSTTKSSTISQSIFSLRSFFLCTLFLLLFTSHASAQPPPTATRTTSHKHPAWSRLNVETVDSKQTVQHNPESLQSGIPDLVATAGRLFRYRIPGSAFSGTVLRYQVYIENIFKHAAVLYYA